MDLLILVLVFGGTMLLLLGTYTFVFRRRIEAAAATRERLMGVTHAPSSVSIFKDERVSALSFLNRLLAGRSFTESLLVELQRAGSQQKPGEFVLVTVVCATLGFLAGQWLFISAMMGLICSAICLSIPWLLLKRKQLKRLGKFETQFPDALDMLVNALRAGYSLQAAMEFVGREIGDPLGPEFARFYDEQRLGIEVRVALLDLQERVGTDDIKMFVTSLLIQRETGGNLAEVLGNIGSLMRERAAFRGHVKTLMSEPQFSGVVLALLPVGLFFLFVALNREYERVMWTTPTGRLLLLGAACSVAIGYIIMMQMSRIEM